MGRALRDFFADLMAGDPVALGLIGAVLAVLLIIGLWGAKIMRDKRRIDEERKSRVRKSTNQKL